MGNKFVLSKKLLKTALLTTALLTSSASHSKEDPIDTVATVVSQDAAAPSAVPASASESKSRLKKFSASAGELAMQAMGLLGIRYKYGGDTPDSGLDCSGFVRYVFKQASGEDLPRTSSELNQVGTKVANHELSLGDLVFFKTVKNAVSHVGIYLGGNKFIHSPRAGGEVRVESMAGGYWRKRFAGGRRLIDG